MKGRAQFSMFLLAVALAVAPATAASVAVTAPAATAPTTTAPAAMAPATKASDQPSEREKFEADQAFRNRQLAQAERETEQKLAEHRQARWNSPLILAIAAATIAAFANIGVAFWNGRQQRILEKERADQNRVLEKQKAEDQVALERSKAKDQRDLEAQQAESARILEMTKTAGSRDAAADNLQFLLQAGLVTGPLAERLRNWHKSRNPGEGPSLPSVDGRFRFEPRSKLPPDVQKKIGETLKRFLTHLDRIGFESSGEEVTIDALDVDNAQYSPKDRAVGLGPSFHDPAIACREYFHHVMLETNPAGWSEEPAAQAIESAVADYFPCSFLDRPVVGEGLGRKLGDNRDYLRTLKSPKGYADLSDGSDSAHVHSDGEIWASLFWDIRSTIGQAATDQLVRKAWSAVRWPQARADIRPGFIETLLKSASDGAGKEVAAVRDVLEQRGFPIGRAT